MQPTLTIALRAARAAAEKLKYTHDQKPTALAEGKSAQAVLEDAIEGASIRVGKVIRKAHPGHNIEVLQTGLNEARTPEDDILWRINLLSGAENYEFGMPDVAVSVAYLVKGKVEHAAVVNPFTEEEYTATRGRGMQHSGRRVRVSNQKKLSGALVALADISLTDGLVAQLQEQEARIRISGCGLLDLANAASGRVSVALVNHLNEYELQVASLFAQEAGGLTSTLTGQPVKSDSAQMLIANAKLFKALMPLLAR